MLRPKNDGAGTTGRLYDTTACHKTDMMIKTMTARSLYGNPRLTDRNKRCIMMVTAVLLLGTILVIFQKSSDPAGSRSRQAHSDSDVTGNDDPSQPVPRTKEEVDWWKRHDVLVKRVE
eukprot:scaffold46639_cov24-Attheya_sp.AAC.1